jgi:ABC-type lipoprotein export system ATPase subunit
VIGRQRPGERLDRPAAALLEGASKRYGRGPQSVAAVVEVSLRVRPGEFVSVMGPSGCGKSTLLNLIAGLDAPDSGRVVVCGHDLARLSDNQRSDLRLQSIGFVFQSFNLFPTFTVEENVAWPLEFLGVRWREARARAGEALDQVGVARGAAERRPAELSGGEQQRVAVARALVTNPVLLLADEPTGNLDSRSGQAVLDLLRGLSSERDLTVVMVTHNTFAATYGHRTIELRDGQIVREARAPRDDGARVVPLREGT